MKPFQSLFVRSLLLAMAHWTVAQAQLPAPMIVKGEGFSITLKYVPAGAFSMGDSALAHPVRLAAFWMAETEVTEGLFLRVMARSASENSCEQCPATGVSWEDATEFCQKLNKLTGKGKQTPGFRLPTEAEWEYAAGGGPNQRTRWAGTSNPDSLRLYAWSMENSLKIRPVKTLLPNSLGLYDLSGSVWEWCQDWYSSDYYLTAPEANPPGPANGQSKVCRGGAWTATAAQSTIFYRNYLLPDAGNNRLGFRLCLSAE